MLPLLIFGAAGFFWSALPWGMAGAIALQLAGMIATRQRYRPWLERSRPALAQIIAMQLAVAAIVHTALMIPGNLIMGLPIIAP